LIIARVAAVVEAPFEQGEIGPDLFRHACLMGLEGLVSKHRDSVYHGGRYYRWIKVKNRQHAAFSRVMEQLAEPWRGSYSCARGDVRLWRGRSALRPAGHQREDRHA
jgi:hypothetical protein